MKNFFEDEKMKEMSIKILFDKLSEILGQELKAYRKIQVDKVNGRKIPKGEKNDLTIEEIQINRGLDFFNNYSLYVKHIPKLYVVDFDTKELSGCKLKEFLDNKKNLFTETTKGYHYYIFIEDMIEYSNQQKIYKNNEFDVDLIKKNNIWEPTDRKIKGFFNNINSFKWNEISCYFDIEKMNAKKSATEVKKSSKTFNPINDDEKSISPPLSEFDEITDKEFEKIKKAVKFLKPERATNYQKWLEVGFALYNGGNNRNNETMSLWNEFSKKNKEKYDVSVIFNKWSSFKPKVGGLSFNSIYHWLQEDNPREYSLLMNEGNKYNEWFLEGIDVLVNNMNSECMYYNETGFIIYYIDGRMYNNKQEIARSYYKKFSFRNEKILINPFNLWLENINRKEINEIVFDPRGTKNDKIINLWKGFKIKNTGKCNEEKISHFLNHIKHIWAGDDEESYNYILNWFSRILQQPYNKNGICLVLQSKEGIGKSIVLDLIKSIIGEDYYLSTTSLEEVLGRFNSQAEQKLLVNFNETNWGGDKKMKGRFKSFITDTTISIEHKGKKPYVINNLSNCIITTNEEWVIDIKADDRRFNLVECKNEINNHDYFDKLANTDLQELANYFYNRDISNYNPRKFNKNEKHKLQVEMNYNSVELFIKSIIEGDILLGEDDEVDEEEIYKTDKATVYDRYLISTTGSHQIKYNRNHFWTKFRALLPSVKFIRRDKLNAPSIKYSLKEIEEDFKKK